MSSAWWSTLILILNNTLDHSGNTLKRGRKKQNMRLKCSDPELNNKSKKMHLQTKKLLHLSRPQILFPLTGSMCSRHRGRHQPLRSPDHRLPRPRIHVHPRRAHQRDPGRAHGWGGGFKTCVAELFLYTPAVPSLLILVPPQVVRGVWSKARAVQCTCTRRISTEATASWELR